MDIKIIVATNENVSKANEFLTRLIRDEKQYDNNIDKNCVVNSLYEKLLENPNNCILFAKVNNQIIGYLYGFLIDNGDACLEKTTKLEALFVDENHRRNMVGNKLIDEFKLWSKNKNAKYIELKVCDKNNHAIDLYRSKGFNKKKNIMVAKLD